MTKIGDDNKFKMAAAAISPITRLLLEVFARNLAGGDNRAIDAYNIAVARQSTFAMLIAILLRATAACLSHRNSVCLSVRPPFVRLSVSPVDQSKTVQARITKSLRGLPKRL